MNQSGFEGTGADGLPQKFWWVSKSPGSPGEDPKGTIKLSQFDVATAEWTTMTFPPFDPASPPAGLPQRFKDWLMTDNGKKWYADPPADGMGCSMDLDQDNLADMNELRLGTDPTDVDTDDDGFSDGEEAALGSDPTMTLSTPEDMSRNGSCSNGLDDDHDGLTDAADPGCRDTDGDGVPDSRDFCPNAFELDQYDLDGDGLGPACDDDDDGDMVPDLVDLCPYTIPTEDVDANGCSERQLAAGPAPADVLVKIMAAPEKVKVGEKVTYTIEAANVGPSGAFGVTVTDMLPAGLTFVSCDAPGGTCGGSGNDRTVMFDELPPGAVRTIRLVASVDRCPDGASISNMATIGAAVTVDPVPDNNDATAEIEVSNGLPAIGDVTVDRPILWPPNHKFVLVTLAYTVSNGCETPVCTLEVRSSEPVNGLGDGDTAPDWEVIDPRHVRLRAERSGRGSGRVYTITVRCNGVSKAVQVKVPKSQGQGPALRR